jgi:hypothetical protein
MARRMGHPCDDQLGNVTFARTLQRIWEKIELVVAKIRSILNSM